MNFSNVVINIKNNLISKCIKILPTYSIQRCYICIPDWIWEIWLTTVAWITWISCLEHLFWLGILDLTAIGWEVDSMSVTSWWPDESSPRFYYTLHLDVFRKKLKRSDLVFGCIGIAIFTVHLSRRFLLSGWLVFICCILEVIFELIKMMMRLVTGVWSLLNVSF